MLTLDEALAELSKLLPSGNFTTKQLMDLAAEVSLDAASGYTQGSVTLLNSGQINGVNSEKYIEQIVADGADIRVIDKTQVGQFLANKKFSDAWKLAGGTATELYHGSNGPWAKASAHFVANTVGEVRLLGFNASDRSVFINTELKTSLGPNSRITSIEGISVVEPRSIRYSDSGQGPQAEFSFACRNEWFQGRCNWRTASVGDCRRFPQVRRAGRGGVCQS